MKYPHALSLSVTASRLRTVHLKGPTILRLESGAEFRVEPVGDGITIAPIPKKSKQAPKRPRKGGRKPAPETQALRDEMTRDAEKGALHAAPEYIAWLRARRPEASLSSLQQIVYRERRLVQEQYPEARAPVVRPAGKGGRGASHVTVTLREKLNLDVAGELRNADHYVRWLVDAADVGLKQARPVVYREMRRLEA